MKNIEEFNKRLGEYIREEREFMGMTREDMVTKLGDITLATYRNIERGNGSARFEVIASIAEALDLTVEDMLDAAKGVNHG